MQTPTVKETLHTVANQLPDSATWNDALYKLHVRRSIEEGIKELDTKQGVAHQQVMQNFPKPTAN
ncbi:MAG TPA: hypothetical protein PLH12_08110 [Pseudomonadales bacterium]|jgi:hypothetical protein|nr:hypothetical protein [Pseudomonadales bacterium]